MQGIKIKCPICREICFETTEKFRPDVTVNGSMVRKLPRITWHIDWLCSDVTPAAQMTCPMCDVGQLAPSGRLMLVDPPQVETPVSPEEITPEAAQKAQPLNSFTDTGIRIPMEEANELDEALDKVSVGPQIFICDVCGKGCKSQFGLNSHKRSHRAR